MIHWCIINDVLKDYHFGIASIYKTNQAEPSVYDSGRACKDTYIIRKRDKINLTLKDVRLIVVASFFRLIAPNTIDEK